MNILGISAFYHDSACAIVIDGETVAAVQEERLSRSKNDPTFPSQAIRACLTSAGLRFDDLDIIVFYEKPHLKLSRLLGTGLARYPKGKPYYSSAIRAWAEDKFWMPTGMRDELFSLSESFGRKARWNGNLLYTEHHRSHAASAFYPSPFEDAAIVVIDGVGEWSTASIGFGKTHYDGVPGIELFREVRFPHSLGLFYSAMTNYLGFQVNDGEYKVMGLAPYGTAIHFESLVRNAIQISSDGSFSLDMRIFTFDHSHKMYDPVRLEELFGVPPRNPGEELQQSHADIAASVQAVTESVVLGVANAAYADTSCPRLTLAGGVALNCVANGRLLVEGPFDDVWVQPAAGDAGGALGAALDVWHRYARGRRPRRAPGVDRMQASRLGPAYGDFAVAEALDERKVRHMSLPNTRELVDTTADLLAAGAIVAWFQGRMEFGPRALGGRSILAHPARDDIQLTLNLRVKRRESFRPFAPVILREKAADWFDLAGRDGSVLGSPSGGYDSQYMLLVGSIKKHRLKPGAPPVPERKLQLPPRPPTALPACTHVDYSARIQTVALRDDPLLYRLLLSFERVTGLPVLVNTSFNLSDEPIVCSPSDAVDSFIRSDIDFLVMNRTIAWMAQPPAAWLHEHREGDKE